MWNFIFNETIIHLGLEAFTVVSIAMSEQPPIQPNMLDPLIIIIIIIISPEMGPCYIPAESRQPVWDLTAQAHIYKQRAAYATSSSCQQT